MKQKLDYNMQMNIKYDYLEKINVPEIVNLDNQTGRKLQYIMPQKKNHRQFFGDSSTSEVQ